MVYLNLVNLAFFFLEPDIWTSNNYHSVCTLTIKQDLSTYRIAHLTAPCSSHKENFAVKLKGRFLDFRRYHNFANLLSKLSESTFYNRVRTEIGSQNSRTFQGLFIF